MTKLERFQSRAHRLICEDYCLSSNFDSIETHFCRDALNFLLKCEHYERHSLHLYVPPQIIRTRMFALPSCRTDRKLRSFFPFASLFSLANNFCEQFGKMW